MKRSPQLHRIAEFLSGEDKDTKEVQLVYDAKIYPRSRTGVKKYCLETMSLAASLKKGGSIHNYENVHSVNFYFQT